MKEGINEWKLGHNWLLMYNYQTGNEMVIIILFHMLERT